MKYSEPRLPTAGDIRDVENVIRNAREKVASGRYWPSQDYPDREEWLARRYTAPANSRTFMYFDSLRWGTLNIGVNTAKRKARVERRYFRTIPIVREGQPLFTIMREDGSPSLHRQLMTIRRKAQRQGPVTIEPSDKDKHDRRVKRHLK